MDLAKTVPTIAIKPVAESGELILFIQVILSKRRRQAVWTEFARFSP